jgi:hypothetical protein
MSKYLCLKDDSPRIHRMESFVNAAFRPVR